jgi:3-oxoacyl-[acyl-carrier-protein] synthase-1
MAEIPDKNIYITGMGAICAIGANVKEITESLQMGLSGIEKTRYLEGPLNFETVTGEVALTNTELAAYTGVDKKLPRTTLLAVKAADEALTNANITNTKDLRVGIILGTTVGGMDKTERLITTDAPVLEYIPSHHCGFTTNYLANYFKINDYQNTISTACSSGANALMTGARLIKQGVLDMVLAGGADALSAFTLNGFNSLLILDKDYCRPFSAERKGLNLGEGAGFLVLESAELAQKRGAKKLGVLSGYANTNDAFHQTASSPDGRGAYNAMKGALEKANLKPVDIDYINAHGTGTENNDLTEGIAINNLFNNKVPSISTTKAYTGHCLGAAGAIEAIISILAIQNQEVYPNLRLGNPLSETGPFPIKEYTKKSVKHVLSNSFGFGGCDTALVFSSVDS